MKLIIKLTDRAQDRIVKAGIIGRFVDLLASPLLQVLAAKTLASFADYGTLPTPHDPPTLLDYYVIEMTKESLLFPALLKVVGGSSLQATDAPFYALRALYLLATSTPEAIEKLKLVGGFDIICQQLGSPRDDIRVKCLAFISLFSEQGFVILSFLIYIFIEANMDILRRLHVLETLVYLLNNTPVSSEHLLSNLLAALEPIVFNGKKAIILYNIKNDLELNWKALSGSCKQLLHIMTVSNNVEVLRRATKLLSELLRDDSSKELTVSAGGISILADLFITAPDEEMLESIVFGISFLSDSSTFHLFFLFLLEEFRSGLLTASIVERGFILLKKNYSPLLKEKILYTLANLASERN
jgi:hypothetical protein